jgi:hypothetical protein
MRFTRFTLTAPALPGGRWQRFRERSVRRGAELRPGRRPQVEELEERNLLAAWTPLSNAAPDFAGTMMLMTNGQVLVQGYTPGNNFMLLTPDASGSYINGTWSSAASMSTPRLYYASNVLPTGKVFLLGGEYTGDINAAANWDNTGEIYDPVANTWSPIATFPDPSGHFGDDPSMLLSNGTDILTGGGAFEGGITYVYHSNTNTWSGPISKVYNSSVEPAIDTSDEEGWVKLANGNVLNYDLFASTPFNAADFDPNDHFINPGGSYAEVFNPSTGAWSSISPSDGTANGFIPQLSSVATGFELGPMMRLQDGRVLVLGATGASALYNPTTNTWSAGPNIMGTLNGSPALFGADDAPAAELPNGHVIFAADAGPTSGIFSPPTEPFDFNPANNTITQVAPALNEPDLTGEPSYPLRMLELPNGQMLLNVLSNQLFIYTPDGKASPQLRPSVDSVTFNNGVFTLTGEQLNGPSSGSSYGDDVESDENYPIVSLKYPPTGQVFYARTSNWSSTGVGTGSQPETVNFTLPAGMPAGEYLLTESGAGIQSTPFPIRINSAEATAAPADAQGAFATDNTPGVSTVTIRGSANPGMVGVSLALTHTGVVSHATALSGPRAAADAGTAAFGLSHGVLLQDAAAATLAAPQLNSTNAGTMVLDALFANYFISPF